MVLICDNCKKYIDPTDTPGKCDCGNCDELKYCHLCTFECDRCEDPFYIGHKKYDHVEDGMCHTCHKHNDSVKQFTDLGSTDLKYIIHDLQTSILLKYTNLSLTKEEFNCILYEILILKENKK